MWRAVALWTFVALATFLAASLSVGLAFGLYRRPADGTHLTYALGGMLVPALAFVRFLHLIAPALFAACALWSVMARAIPVLEASQFGLAVFLSGYAALLCALIWLAFPLDRQLALPTAVLFFLALVAPRFVIRALAAGVFAA